MKVGEISNPIFKQGTVLLLKINQKRTKKLDKNNIEDIKNKF